MIVRAIERGLSEDKLARALNVDIKRVKTKRTLLDGVCPEVAEMLKDKTVDTDVFTLWRKMKPLRRIGAVELMLAMNNFTARYSHALLRATRREDLLQLGKIPPDPQSTGEPLSRTRSPGDADRIQSCRCRHVVGGNCLRGIGRARLLGLITRSTVPPGAPARSVNLAVRVQAMRIMRSQSSNSMLGSAQQRHKIIRKTLALLGGKSVSVVTAGTGPTPTGDPTHARHRQ